MLMRGYSSLVARLLFGTYEKLGTPSARSLGFVCGCSGFLFSQERLFWDEHFVVHARFVVVRYLTASCLSSFNWPNHYLSTYHVVTSSPKSIEPAVLLFPFILCVKDTNFEERV